MVGQARATTGVSARGRRAWRVAVCGAAVSVSLVCALSPATAAPKPPPNPSDSQLGAAAAAKASLANTVGTLSGQIVQAQTALQSLNAQAELQEQKYAYAVSKLTDAKDSAVRARAAVDVAQQGIDDARQNLTSFVRSTYMAPSTGSTTVGLLTATDPDALLQSGDYQHYVSAHNLTAIGALDRATVAKSNADAKAKASVELQRTLTDEAAQAQRAAQAAYANKQAQAEQLRTQQAGYQKQLVSAQTQLAALNGQRATFLAYQQEQARIAAEKARQLALARARAAAAQARALAQQRAAQAEAEAEAEAAAERQRARDAANNSDNGSSSAGNGNSGSSSSAGDSNSGGSSNGNGNSGSSSGGSSTNGNGNGNGNSGGGSAGNGNSGGSSNGGGGSAPLPAPGSMGGWTAAKGQAAARRAMNEIGTPYSWAAGNYDGPTYGVDSPGTDGWNDSTVLGFDCSGLTMYGWAPQGLYLPHYAAAQYLVAGSYHPQPGQFLPGDLLFWSDAGQSSIHHVAMYIGGGNVVQAPNSGDIVKITPWDQVASGYYGATRPLS